MPIVPSINEDFDSPIGTFSNYVELLGEVSPSPSFPIRITPSVPPQIGNLRARKHIDIRNFEKSSRTTPRTQRELEKYHQDEIAYHQTLTVSGSLPDGGTFNIIWYDENGNRLSTNVPFNVTPDQLVAVLEGFVGEGNVTISNNSSGSVYFPFNITFAQIDYVVTLDVESFLTNAGNPVDLIVIVGDPRNPDLRFLASADPLDPHLEQIEIEQTTITSEEIWEIVNSPGYSTDVDMIVGKFLEFNNWRGLNLSLNDAFNPSTISIVSRDKNRPLNLLSLSSSASDIFISFTMPNLPITLLNLANCWIQFTSDPQGIFAEEGGSAQDTSKVTFTGHLTLFVTSQEFRAPISLFEEGSSANLQRITGVKIHFASNGSSVEGQEIFVFGLRAINGGWTRMSTDINTVNGSLVHPIHLTGSPLSPDSEPVPPLIRAAWPPSPSTIDPLPSDVTLAMEFNTGNLGDPSVLPNGYNILQIILRENQLSPDETEFMVAELWFNREDIVIYRYSTHRTLSGSNINDVNLDSNNNLTVITNVKNGSTIAPGILSPLKPNTDYRFEVEALGNGIRCAIYGLGDSGLVQYTHFDTDFVFNQNFLRRAGRVGFWAKFIDFDVEVKNFFSNATVYSVIRTSVFHTHTPIDGAQLSVEGSQEVDIFSGFISVDPFDQTDSDSQKSLSGSSVKFTPNPSSPSQRVAGLTSNVIQVDDWRHTSVAFDIWIPSSISSNDGKMPRLYFKAPNSILDVGPGTGSYGPIDIKVIPNNWTRNSIDLIQFDRLATGQFELWIVGLEAPQESWWIDNISVNRLAVEWKMRAIEDGEWISFGHMVNNPNGALHLPPDQRGTALQLQAEALVQDAWISSYTLQPHYAELGRILPTVIAIEE